MLPAQRGDCLWLTYGSESRPRHVLIDGGPRATIADLVPELESRLHALPGRTNRVELLVVSHVDADHIQGIVSLLSDHRRVRLFRDVWFNGYRHLDPDQLLGAVDGERLTAALESDPERWNAAFAGAAVVVPDDGPLPVVALPGGLELTLLTPTRTALAELAPEWEETCRKAGILPGHGAEITAPSWVRDDLLGFDIDVAAAEPYHKDRSKPNTSSITMIAAYEGKRVLLLADGDAEDVVAGLRRLGPGPHEFDAVKMAHHGSRHNTSPELCRMVTSRNWLVSTNGATFHHPDTESLARVVVSQRRPTFLLNYCSDDVADLVEHQGERYRVRLPRWAGRSYGTGKLLRLC